MYGTSTHVYNEQVLLRYSKIKQTGKSLYLHKTQQQTGKLQSQLSGFVYLCNHEMSILMKLFHLLPSINCIKPESELFSNCADAHVCNLTLVFHC